MRLGDLFDGVAKVPRRWQGIEVGGVTADSRHVRRGDLFVAVPGERLDGHDFLAEALSRGASALAGEKKPGELNLPRAGSVPYVKVRCARTALAWVAAAFYGHPSRRLRVAGVTGTKGKTTVTWFLDSILRRNRIVTGLFGTVENRIAARTFPARQTTAGAVDLQEWLSELVASGGTHAVLEVSSHALVQRRTEAIDFDVAIFTNISPEHLDYHGTFENYFEAKASFFENLRAGATAVLPLDQPHGRLLAERTKAKVVWYGAEPAAGVERVRQGPEGLEFVWKDEELRTRLYGHHNLLNALAAMEAAEALGLSREAIAAAVEHAVLPPGRMEEVEAPVPFRVIVDYAHTDGALEAVLSALRPVTRGRLITVFGCGGDRDRSKRPRMGAVAERWSDHVIVTSDNPRSEPPGRILEEIARGMEHPQDAVFIEDRREAIALAVRMAKEGDTVLIAGKGHETYQEIGNRAFPFDDRDVAREFLEELVRGTRVLGV